MKFCKRKSYKFYPPKVQRNIDLEPTLCPIQIGEAETKEPDHGEPGGDPAVPRDTRAPARAGRRERLLPGPRRRLQQGQRLQPRNLPRTITRRGKVPFREEKKQQRGLPQQQPWEGSQVELQEPQVKTQRVARQPKVKKLLALSEGRTLKPKRLLALPLGRTPNREDHP